jgi:hypothetical protein
MRAGVTVIAVQVGQGIKKFILRTHRRKANDAEVSRADIIRHMTAARENDLVTSLGKGLGDIHRPHEMTDAQQVLRPDEDLACHGNTSAR